MKPEERDALIDGAVITIARYVEHFHEELTGEENEAISRVVVEKVGALIAAGIRKEFAKPARR